MTAACDPSNVCAPGIPRGHVARAFGQAAASYDAFASLQRDVADRLLAMVNVTDAATALDLGCGTGHCALQLRKRYPDAQLVALDLALPMLHASQHRLSGDTQLLCGDLQALPLQSATADLAVSSLAMQWCGDVRNVFAELRRVLRSGGQAVLSTFGPATLQELRAAWRTVDSHVHVNAFPDAHALQQAAHATGFGVCIHSDVQMRHYASLRALAHELKGIGAHNMNAARPRGLTSRSAFARAEQQFSSGMVAGLGVPVTWEVYYVDLQRR